MKTQDDSLKFRLAAFVVLAAFTAAGCSIPASSEAALPETPSYPVDINPTLPAKQMSFYLTDEYEPSATDKGKTAFYLDGPSAPKDFMAVAEEQEDGDTAVRFLDGGNGMAASVYFSGGAVPAFPSGFVLNRENEDTVTGTFSPYHEDVQTFSLTLAYEGETQTFDGLVLNKNIFSAYQDDDSLTPGQNTRVRNYVIAAGLWTAITLQFEEEAEAVPLNGISMPGNFAGGPQYSFWGALKSKNIEKAVEKMRVIGAAITDTAAAVFGKASKALATAEVAIGVTVSAPKVTAIAAPVVITAAIVNVGDAPSDPGLPLEKRQAPRLRIYYRDEAGAEHPIPVMRQGKTPQISQEFYIRPHGSDKYTAVSGVKFYFEVGLLEAIDGEVMTKYIFSVKDTPYRQVETGVEDGVNYFEVKKRNGIGDDIRTALTVKAYDGSITPLAEVEKKNGNLAYFPYYYVNDEEFSEGDGFVLHFIDDSSYVDESQTLIPEHFVGDSAAYNAVPDVPLLPLLN